MPSAECFKCFVSAACEHVPFDSYASALPASAGALPFVKRISFREPGHGDFDGKMEAMVLPMRDESAVTAEMDCRNHLFDS